MTTSTDELRRLLDERGVEYRVSATGYSIDIGPNVTAYANRTDTTLDVSLRGFTPEQAVEATLGPLVTGDTSDGYHTFNELYHHRAVLFSVIVRDHRELAWKSMRHHDGTMFDGMFIVGIETPKGQATYHYDIDPYWDMFDCKELECAPEWDGHTPDEAIERIATLGSFSCTNDERTGDELGPGTCHDKHAFDSWGMFTCSACGALVRRDAIHVSGFSIGGTPLKFCPNCGRKVVDE